MGVDVDDGVGRAEAEELADEAIFAVGQAFGIEREGAFGIALGVADELVLLRREQADAELRDWRAILVGGGSLHMPQFDRLRIKFILMQVRHVAAGLGRDRGCAAGEK